MKNNLTRKTFNFFWQGTSREEILNQYYYDYKELQELRDANNKLTKILVIMMFTIIILIGFYIAGIIKVNM